MLSAMVYLNTINEFLYYWTATYVLTYLQRLANNIIKNPRLYILGPVSIVFVISYPAIYTLYSTPNLILLSSISNFKSIEVVNRFNTSTPTPYFNLSGIRSGQETNVILVKQLWITPLHAGYSEDALEKRFLKEAIRFQDRLLEGINVENYRKEQASGEKSPDNAITYVNSVLGLWNNSQDTLDKDLYHLKTIQATLRRRKESLEIPTIPVGLLGGITKNNGLVVSAEALKISLFYTNKTAGDAWDGNLKAMNMDNEFRYIAVARDVQYRSYEEYMLRVNKLSLAGKVVLLVCNIMIVIYFMISLWNVNGVKSKLGLLLAFIVAMVLSLLSAITITFYIYNDMDLLQIPVQLLSFIVVVVGIENMFRLITSVTNIKDAYFNPTKFARLVASNNIVSTIIVMVDMLVLAMIIPFVQQSARQFCVFAFIALTINHFLHMTYFTAVLSVDIRRLELEDLLQNASKEERDGIGSYNYRKSFDWMWKISFHQSSFSSKLDSIKHILYHSKLKIKLPISSSITGSIFMLLIIALVSIKWISGGVSFDLISRASDVTHSPSIVANPMTPAHSVVSRQNHINSDLSYSCFYSPKILGMILGKLVLEHAGNSQYRIFVEEPVFVLNRSAVGPDFSLLNHIDPSSPIVYHFDIYYFLEFLVSLVFVLAISAIIIKYCLTTDLSHTEKPTEIASNRFQAKELVNGHALDIVRISSNKTSPFVVSIGMDHRVLVWSPAANPVPLPMGLPVARQIWPITHTILSMHGNFIAIFSRKGLIKVWCRLSMSWICSVEIPELKNTVPLESFFRKKTVLKTMRRKPLSRKSSMSSMDSRQHKRQVSNVAFEAPLDKNLENSDYELSMLLRNGIFYTVDIIDGKISQTTIVKEDLVTAKLLVSPRVNDRLVCGTASGKILVATVVNNKWKIRTLFIQENRYNQGKQLMTPLAMQRTNMKLNQSHGRLQRQSSINSMTNVIIPPQVPPEDFQNSTIVPVNFVGMIMRTHGLTAELIDVQTGTLVKRFHIGQFKKGSFHVFHDQPIHCRFCGCASISSFSMAYTELDSDMLIMHTFSIENRAKNSICLRVERDPRETRCLGFDSVTEYQHWLEDVEVWDLTEMNTVQGIKRKSSISIQSEETTSSFNRFNPDGIRLRRRPKHTTTNGAPHISDVWEGFIMNAHGKVTYHDIPNGDNEGLLVKRINSIARFGHKSIIVPFGNIMKVLYLGNEDLIMQNLDEDGNNNQKISGLSFVNKRRMRKTELMGSINYAELPKPKPI